jgi:hypothetical protein
MIKQALITVVTVIVALVIYDKLVKKHLGA